MEKDASDYTLTTILSIMDKNNKFHLVSFYSRALTFIELNYDTYDKKSLVIFEAFKI